MSKRILVCDDAAFMRMMLKNILEQEGYEVCGEAANGVEAVTLFKKLHPDIVTLDITMPEKDGLSALKDIIAYDKNAKVIMCSAMGQQSFVMEAIKNGAKDFVVKPFDKERVLGTILKN